MSDEEFDFDEEMDFGEDMDIEEEDDDEEDVLEDEDEDEGAEEGEGEEFTLNIVEDEDEFDQVVLKKPGKVKTEVKMGVSVGNQLKKVYANMLAEVPRVEVDNVSFSYLSEDEKKGLSVVTIDQTKDINLGSGTLHDPKMGPIYPGKICDTCFRTTDKCPGHYGRIEIPKILHPLADNYIVQVLKSVCHACSKQLISNKTFEAKKLDRFKGMDRLSAISEINTDTCTNKIEVDGKEKICGTKQRKYSKLKSENVVTYQNEDGMTINVFPSDIFTVLDNIMDQDAITLGFGDLANDYERKPNKLTMHPRNFVVQSILVPPNRVRPRVEDSVSGNGDWTDTADPEFKNCITQAEAIRRKVLTKEEKQEIATNIWRTYKQILVGEANPKGGRQSMSTKTRFKGKSGMFGNVIGKRSEQAARSVISPGNSVGFGRVGVPEFARYKITVPERVFEMNRKKLQRDLRKGEVQFIVRKNGSHKGFRIMISDEIRRNYELQNGDVVRRFLRNNDIVYFGRQPSLSAGSLMAMRVVIIKDNTFKFSLASTKSYAGDFDGTFRCHQQGALKVCNSLVFSLNY